MFKFKPIPVTDKFWCQSIFDNNFNEVGYQNNCGFSYEFINSPTGELKFYKTNDININQKSLNKIGDIKTDDDFEKIFIQSFSNLTLLAFFNRYQNLLFFYNKNINKTIMQYDVASNYIWISRGLLYFEDIKKYPFEVQYQIPIIDLIKKYFKIKSKLIKVNFSYYDITPNSMKDLFPEKDTNVSAHIFKVLR